MKVDLEQVSRALQLARGKGLTLKQLAGEVKTSPGDLRRPLSELLKAGRAIFDGKIYRNALRQKQATPPAPQKQPQQAQRRAQPASGPEQPKRKPPSGISSSV